ncbi:MAG: hypothetical protein LUI39_13335 [Lachnospiraceae bacterium]|nr:hypothetical protein [Lachnospiraceae bacterium]
MFHKEDLQCLDPDYFAIIHVDDYDVTVMSKNTGHVWYIHNVETPPHIRSAAGRVSHFKNASRLADAPEYPLPGSCVIFHKHKASHPYHQHGRSNTLRQAIRSIRKHDRYQMNGRRGSGKRIQE